MNKSSSRGQVLVWDLPIRIIHWGFVSIVVLNYFILEEGKAPHRYLGYLACAFVAFRIFWGFKTSTEYGRFKSFWPTVENVKNYIQLLFKGQAPRMLSHNPLAALMMILLCVLILLLGLSGWMMSWDRFWGEEWLEETHEILAHTLIASAGLHAVASIVESFKHKENLIASMIHGKKIKD